MACQKERLLMGSQPKVSYDNREHANSPWKMLVSIVETILVPVEIPPMFHQEKNFRMLNIFPHFLSLRVFLCKLYQLWRFKTGLAEDP